MLSVLISKVSKFDVYFYLFKSSKNFLKTLLFFMVQTLTLGTWYPITQRNLLLWQIFFMTLLPRKFCGFWNTFWSTHNFSALLPSIHQHRLFTLHFWHSFYRFSWQFIFLASRTQLLRDCSSSISGHIFQQNFSTGLSDFFPTLPHKSCRKFPLPPLHFTLDFKISSPQLTCSIALLIFCSHAEDLLFPKIRPCFSIQALSSLFAWRLYVIEALSLRCIINTTPDPSFPTRRFSRPH